MESLLINRDHLSLNKNKHFFFYYNETHVQYKPPKHKIKEKITALIQYKTRYRDPYLQPVEYKGKSNKQTNKQTFG